MVGPVEIVEVGGHVLEEDIAVTVSVCQAFVKPASVDFAFDPAQLETWAEQIQAAAQTHQTAEGPWFFRVNRIRFDLRNQRIDCVCTGRAFNLGTWPN